MVKKFLLVGGNGFIGKNLMDYMKKYNLDFESIDIDDEDLEVTNKLMVQKLIDKTDILLLASKVGAELFNKNPLTGYNSNIKILENMVGAIELSNKIYKRKYNVTWFSTSEIFGSINSDDEIMENSDIRVDINSSRSLYSIVKITGEIYLKQLFKCGILSSLNIFRLFNISGKYQTRGVLYEMINSAVTNGVIRYSCDTTRTITPIDYAMETITRTILDNSNDIIIKNIAKDENSMYMKDLALIVKSYLENECGFVNLKMKELPSDDKIQYRHTRKPEIGSFDYKILINEMSEIFESCKH